MRSVGEREKRSPSSEERRANKMTSVRLIAWALIAVSALWRALGHIDNTGLSILCGAVITLAHLG